MPSIRVHYNPDKTAFITHYNFTMKKTGETDTEFMDRCETVHLHTALPNFDMDSDDLPDRTSTTRSAWRADEVAETVTPT